MLGVCKFSQLLGNRSILSGRGSCSPFPPNVFPSREKSSRSRSGRGGRVLGRRLITGDSSKNANSAEISTRMPLVALQSPIFPKFNHWVSVSNEKLSEAVAEAYEKGPQLVACFAQRDITEAAHVSDLRKIYHVGTLARITKFASLTSKDTRMVVSGIRRIKLAKKTLDEYSVDFHRKSPEFDKYPDYIHDNSTNFDYKNPSIEEILRRTSQKISGGQSDEIVKEPLPVISHAWVADYPTRLDACEDARATVLANEIVNSLKEVVGLSTPPFTIHTELSISGKFTLNDYIAIADTVSFIRYRPHFLQDIVEEADIVSRLERAHYMLKRELEISKISYDISKQTNESIYRMGRRNYLFEQLRAIQKELGVLSGGDSSTQQHGEEMARPRRKNMVEKFVDRMASSDVPEEVLEVFQDEIFKLQSMEPTHTEYQSVCNYLDAVTTVPWGKYSTPNYDLTEARRILDEDHYGISEVKDLIIEHLAVSSQSEKCRGKIMCLAGPPGVGKTSIGKSIARCLNKEYVRLSVGGMDDVAEIKGHRRTYLGSMPGRVVSCLQKAKTMNPVILLDEIDKMSRSYKGDPSSALLEALDPEQNFNFLDHFLDFPVDLSKCMFIGTANDLSTIQKPLLDRMEVIKLSSYTSEEKYNIAKRHVIPETINFFGINPPESIKIEEDALNCMIDDYSREPGMRSLKKTVEKAVTKIQQGEKPPVLITCENLNKFIGAPSFHKERYFEKAPVGVVPGLAYTGLGGSVLYIESIALPKRHSELSHNQSPGTTTLPDIIVTGLLGEAMKESCKISKSVASSFLYGIEPDNNYFETNKIHSHFPDGASPKDGPSAGIAIATSYISLAINMPVRPDLTMTGELCLSKHVLPIGGLTEKLLSVGNCGVT